MSATPEQIGEQVIDDMRHIALLGAMQAREAFTPVEARMIDMWPVPDPGAELARKREAVAAVLRRFEPAMVATSELLDELVAAAETGF